MVDVSNAATTTLITFMAKNVLSSVVSLRVAHGYLRPFRLGPMFPTESGIDYRRKRRRIVPEAAECASMRPTVMKSALWYSYGIPMVKKGREMKANELWCGGCGSS